VAIKSRTARKPAVKRRATTKKLHFIESMECLPVAKLPEGPEWSYEIKLDGYRLEAIKEAKETRLYSRRGNLLTGKFPYLAAALSKLPNGTILDGEVVALDAQRRSDFNLLQNFRSTETHIHYYAFDILVLRSGTIRIRGRSSERTTSLAGRNAAMPVSPSFRKPVHQIPGFATK
jgi:ATP-dependent DNA ligase